MRRTYSFWFFLFSIIFILTSCENKRNVVAEVGELQISRQEFQEHLNRFKHSSRSVKPFTFDEKIKQIQSILNQKIEFLIAKDQGLVNDPVIKLKAEVNKELAMVQKWQREILKSELINDRALHQYYRKKHEFAKYKHILISHHVAFPALHKRSLENARKLADSLKKVIDAGTPFDSLVAKYSDDPKTKTKFGLVGWENRAQMPSPFEKAVFSAPLKTVIGPILDRKGFHIVIVLDRKQELPDKPFSAIKNQLRKEYEKKINSEYYKYLRKYQQRFIKEYHVQLNEKDAKTFYELAKKWTADPRREENDLYEKTKNLILFTADDYQYRAPKLLGQIRDFVNYFQKQIKVYGQFRQFLTRGIPYIGILVHAYHMELDQVPDIRYQYRKAIESQAISALHRQWRLSIKNSEEEMREYYKTHQAEFKNPAKIEVWGIAIRNRDKAQQIFKLAKKLPTIRKFQKLAEKYSENKLEARKKGYLGFLTPIDRKSISSVAFQYGPDQLIPPVKTEYYYYILRTGKMIPEKIPSFEEAKLDIDKKLFTRKFNDIRLKKIAEYKNKINPFTIYLSVIREINI
jgi:parvulin-like peptidyl-prolyl isomerase